jgi:thiamine biosynthesis lipoprotein
LALVRRRECPQRDHAPDAGHGIGERRIARQRVGLGGAVCLADPSQRPVVLASTGSDPTPCATGSGAADVQGIEVLSAHADIGVEWPLWRDWQECEFRAMGGPCHLLVADAPTHLVEWARGEVERLEQCWSRFRPDSELSRLNARPGGPVEVSTTMLEALVRARYLHEATGGAFDPTILDALERAGYDRTFPEVQRSGDRGPVEAPSAAPGFSTVMLVVGRGLVQLPPGVRLDLGGVGKGLAADLVAEGLIERGATSACVSMGGDVRVAGSPPAPEGWMIPVEDPFDDGHNAFTWPLTAGAIVTSTTRFRTWTRAGERYHHLIDPGTGMSARAGVSAVVVAADEAWRAEGLAKAVLVRGRDEGAELIAGTGATAWIFGDDRSVTTVTDKLT